MNLKSVFARLKGVRRNGSGWTAHCPAHVDQNPSLSVTEHDGRILLHCHAGCSFEAICEALKVDARDLCSATPEAHSRVIDSTYDYTDETGKLLFQVVRYEPKEFRQRRPDGKGGWIWNLSDVRRVLYRLPEVAGAELVLICEGEKDCETARALGLVATCNPGGAGKWHEEYTEPLRGKRVAVIADADEPGRKHAQAVVISLLRKASSIKLMELPGAKDLSEWVEDGGTRDALLGLIRSTPDWNTAPQSRTGIILTHLGELLSRPDVPVEFVWESRVIAGTVSVVVSKPKVGKSTFARNLCLAVSRGERFLGLETKQGECIYLALEERAEDVRNDFRAMGANGSEPIYVHAASAPIEGIDALCDIVNQRRPVLVVIDPLFRFARIRNANDYAETYAALGPLIDLTREVGTHIMLTHHGGKTEKSDAIDAPLGSTGIGGAVCTLIVLKRRENYRTMQSVQRIGPEMPETVLKFDPEHRALVLGPEKSEADARVLSEAILEHLKSADEPKTEPEIVEAVEGGRTGTKRKALRLLVNQGSVERHGSGKKGDPFKYSFSGSQSILGTRERESQKVPETLVSGGDILVPNSSPDSLLVPVSTKPENQFEEGEL